MSVKTWELFKPNQIVYLEHQQTYLYSEVIQVISSRQLCWVRPLAIAILNHSISAECDFIDLRLTCDLLWPSGQFRPAIDTQVIPLLARLATAEVVLADPGQAKAYLHRFVTQIWSEQDKV